MTSKIAPALTLLAFACSGSTASALTPSDEFAPIVELAYVDGDQLRQGTGIVVSPCLVLTARHVLPSHRLKTITITYYDRERKRAAFASVKIPALRTVNKTIVHADWALLRASPCIGDKTGWFGLDGETDVASIERPLLAVGYPYSIDARVLTSEKCSFLKRDAQEARRGFAADNALVFQCIVKPGQSGGAIGYFQDKSFRVLGIVSQILDSNLLGVDVRDIDKLVKDQIASDKHQHSISATQTRPK